MTEHGNVKVRVVDQVHNADGQPVLDGKGRPKRCQGTYLYGSTAYLPGDIIEMPADVAAKELRLLGGSDHIPAILEPAERHEARLKQQEVLRNRDDHERTAFARKQAELDAQVAQGQKLKELIREREEELRVKGVDVERARAEVPQDVADRLLRLERDAAARAEQAEGRAKIQEIEIARLQKELAARAVPSTAEHAKPAPSSPHTSARNR